MKQPLYPWVSVIIDADDAADTIHKKVTRAMADDGDVPLSAVHHYTTDAMNIGPLRAAIGFVKVYKEVRSL